LVEESPSPHLDLMATLTIEIDRRASLRLQTIDRCGLNRLLLWIEESQAVTDLKQLASILQRAEGEREGSTKMRESTRYDGQSANSFF
jgi:hypothetical protein